MNQDKVADRKRLIECLRKFPFLVTSETCKEFGLGANTQVTKETSVPYKPEIKKQKEPPIGVRMDQSPYDYNQFRPRTQVACCSRNLISTYPREQDSAAMYAGSNVFHVGAKPPPPSSTYHDTIGKTGLEIFKAMKLYKLQKSRRHR